MFNLFKPKSTQNTIQMNVGGINPETENEFLFYDFVEKTPNYILEQWLKKAKQVGYQIRPNYEFAIIEKLNNQNFKNPHSFPEYFDNSFEYIAIDFETANNNRISACAIGLTFVKNNTIVFSKKHFIKTPETERFKKFHTNIHGIVKDDIVNSMSFEELWNYEFSKYFNNNLIVFHNASMELAILKNLFKHYSIEPYNISYLDTMSLAGKLGYSTRLVDLANKFNIVIKNHHDPESDSEMCALIFGELTDRCTNYREYIKQIDSNPKSPSTYQNIASEEVLKENKHHIKRYSITWDELQLITIATKGFVVTGEFDVDRELIKDFLMRRCGQINKEFRVM